MDEVIGHSGLKTGKIDRECITWVFIHHHRAVHVQPSAGWPGEHFHP